MRARGRLASRARSSCARHHVSGLAPARPPADASYNKPYSVSAWLAQREVHETWILMMDTDMFLRAPVDPRRDLARQPLYHPASMVARVPLSRAGGRGRT